MVIDKAKNRASGFNFGIASGTLCTDYEYDNGFKKEK
jgi:hypothetical protein